MIKSKVLKSLYYFDTMQKGYTPEYYGGRNAELDEDLLDVVFEVLPVQAPRGVLVQGSSGRGVRRTLDVIDA